MEPQDNFASWSSSRAGRLRLTKYPSLAPVHVTICTRHGLAHFLDPRLARTLTESLASETQTIAAVLMPNHLHWVLSDASQMARFVGRFKSLSTQAAWRCSVRGHLWQRSYFDNVIRDRAVLRQVVEYILGDPVRAGLVAESSEYRWRVLRAGLVG